MKYLPIWKDKKRKKKIEEKDGRVTGMFLSYFDIPSNRLEQGRKVKHFS